MSATPAVPASLADVRSILTEEFLRKFDTPGPRYTSYPTADRFTESFGPAQTVEVLTQLRGSSSAAPLSLYVHIPFCEQLCYYCGCNKIITKHHERAAQYLDVLEAELALVVQSLGTGRPVSQLHFGGGSPTFLSDEELTRVMRSIGAAFRLTPDSEVSIEVDPRTVTPQRLAHFRTLGFNRLSFGVQDFDPDVQKAVHREQSFEMVRELMSSARELGYASINADLIYGLPKQTPESFARTLQQIGELRPDRIALYAYAHLPERFKPQRRINDSDLPAPTQRVTMLGDAINGFLTAGYDYIGMDHFALPEDSLAVAKREGRLHRNFQGYSTQPDCDLVALGVSAIGRVGSAYYQNAKTLPEYYESIDQGHLPVVRGYALDRDDELRRDVIMSLMCQGRLEFDAIESEYNVEACRYFERELAALRDMADSDLVELQERAVQVTTAGWFLVRAIAMVFDRHLQAAQDRRRFSKVI
jgi:oxygen-independent coproporphyrinogen-3 oxidase